MSPEERDALIAILWELSAAIAARQLRDGGGSDV